MKTQTLKLFRVVFRNALFWATSILFLIFINDITNSSNQFKYILYADDSIYFRVPGDNVVDSAKLITNELKSLNR